MVKLNLKSNTTELTLGFAVFASFLMLAFQGLDFTDLGFWLTGYQDFHVNPASMGCRASCWLTYFICNLFGACFEFNVLAYKIGQAFVTAASAVMSYKLLNSRLNVGRPLAVAIFITALLSRSNGGNWLGYNELTALFYLSGGACLFAGLQHRRMLLVLISGMLLGANCFIRLPNIAGGMLVTAVWLHAWSNQWSLRNQLQWSACFLSGFAAGIAAITLAIYSNGHLEIYINNVHVLISGTAESGGPDSSSSMLRMLVSDHKMAFAKALPLLILGVIISKWAAGRSQWFRRSLVAGCSLLLFLTLDHFGLWRHTIPGVCYVTLAIICFNKFRTDPKLTLLAFISGMLLFLTPLGSNSGMSNATYGLWLSLPLTVAALWQHSDFRLAGFKMDSRILHPFGVILILSLSIHAMDTVWKHTYLDSSSRLNMHSPVNHPSLRGTYTTSERSVVVEDLLKTMPRFVRPGDQLLTYNAIPLLHFLTKTHPYLGEPWPDIVSSKRISKLVRERELENSSLPCIVRATGSTYDRFWPVKPEPPANWWCQDKVRQVFTDFEKRHGYQVVWQNEFFEILMPGK